jgi:hypothetical protein
MTPGKKICRARERGRANGENIPSPEIANVKRRYFYERLLKLMQFERQINGPVFQ